jgi:thiol-disulfide isomerase/thioredoxin
MVSIALVLVHVGQVLRPTTAVARHTEQSAQVQASDIIAVKFHADWCGFCTAMGDVFIDLENKFDGKPVLFVTLDLTSVTTLNRTKLRVSALGIEDAYTANEDTTGFILLLDGETRTIVDRLTSELTLNEMQAALDKSMAE